eukprot:CAMPEP_0194554606 /NCGR_PEP_ID=MMETSP0253-20130528/97823_1 /TAXON_ID=2966 /ORGANISM="Noctiluca scintillans" /LENGTH=36 /DNA_ID= /DNA_START= /DNA_END= /DNA_ORIENTATION=
MAYDAVCQRHACHHISAVPLGHCNSSPPGGNLVHIN